ncbi:NADP-dependent oxidoreductase [Parahaliea sp. F7430]|uniref:NADP-dependent oxidoreductase n=1 Tax=Sediminihaliea albiluteola TaxID=2758564 RepID=A0A7W2TU58_9GAMM|nr:NADP-dependent oxidoreductase [Sediminihaliea albiluteola]MBA6412029.1 NADP-dependent oxidoreductase [Sediminihaliea albiluteola]
MNNNRQWLLKARPEGMIGTEHFELVTSAIPEPAAGQALIKTLMLSFDPAMRGWVEDEPSYLPPVAIGEPMRASGVGQVIRSNNPELPVGSLVQGMLNWQEYSLADPSSGWMPRPLPAQVTPSMALSVLGGTSLTAYFGLLEIGQPVAGETVLVSGAAGATGSVVAQIARLKGCRVIGIAGGEEKCQWLQQDCKIPEVIDYQKQNLKDELARRCADGINVFFDNVGGDTLEAGIEHMADFGRIVMCGAISGYNDASPAPGPRNMMKVITRRLRLQGFIMMDFMDRMEEAYRDLGQWVAAGEIAWREDIQQGFENIPSTLLRLYDGRNQGKQLLQLAEPSH